jgi:hypothetical protein
LKLEKKSALMSSDLPRELGEEGEHQPSLVEVLEQVVEADRLLHVELPVGLQPVVVDVHGLRELLAPLVVAGDLGFEAVRRVRGIHWGSRLAFGGVPGKDPVYPNFAKS